MHVSADELSVCGLCHQKQFTVVNHNKKTIAFFFLGTYNINSTKLGKYSVKCYGHGGF